MNNIAIYLEYPYLKRKSRAYRRYINSQRNIIKNFIFNDQELKKANIEEYIDEAIVVALPRPAWISFLKVNKKDKLYHCKGYVTIYEKLYRDGIILKISFLLWGLITVLMMAMIVVMKFKMELN